MGQTMDQMKLLNQLRKAQKELKNEIVEVEAGDGAVVVQINGELKVKKVKIDPEKVDLDDIQDWDYIIDNNKGYETLKKNVLSIVEKLR